MQLAERPRTLPCPDDMVLGRRCPACMTPNRRNSNGPTCPPARWLYHRAIESMCGHRKHLTALDASRGLQASKATWACPGMAWRGCSTRSAGPAACIMRSCMRFRAADGMGHARRLRCHGRDTGLHASRPLANTACCSGHGQLTAGGCHTRASRTLRQGAPGGHSASTHVGASRLLHASSAGGRGLLAPPCACW